MVSSLLCHPGQGYPDPEAADQEAMAEAAEQVEAELVEAAEQVVAPVYQVDVAEQVEVVCPPVEHHLQLVIAGVAAVSSGSASVFLEASLSHPQQESY